MEKAQQISEILFPGIPPELHLITAVEYVNNAVLDAEHTMSNDHAKKIIHDALTFLRTKAITGEVEAKLKLWTLLSRKDVLSVISNHEIDEAVLWARSLFDRRLLAGLSHCSSELIALTESGDANKSFFAALLSRAATLETDSEQFHYQKLKKRVKNQHKNVLYLTGLLFTEGIGVNRNVSKGVKMLERAYEFGHEGAGVELAKVLNDPYKYPQQYNVEKSVQLFEAIIKRKNINGPIDKTALMDLARVYYEGSDTITRDIEKAYKFARRIAESTGEQYCQFIVGDTLLNPPQDSSIQRDIQQAIFWLTQSGNQGFPLAIETMSRIYFEGTTEGPTRNYESARYWCLLGDDIWPSGLSYCQTCLGDMFYLGLGVPKDLYRAFEYYQKAASQPGASNSYSQFMLGEMFFKTEGWDRNLVVASDYYKMAAKGRYPPAEQRLEELLAIEESSRLVEKTAARKRSWLTWSQLIRKKRGTDIAGLT